MSTHPHRPVVTSYVAPALLGVLWFAGVGAVVASGFSVDGYKLHVMDVPLPHPYPLSGVVVTSGAITVELALLYAVLRPATYASSWGRALCAVFVTTTTFVFSLATLMHAPPYRAVHSLFLLCLTVGSIVLFFTSAALGLHGRFRRRS